MTRLWFSGLPRHRPSPRPSGSVRGKVEYSSSRWRCLRNSYTPVMMLVIPTSSRRAVNLRGQDGDHEVAQEGWHLS